MFGAHVALCRVPTAKEDEQGRKYLQFKNKDGSASSRFTFPSRRVIPIDHVFADGDAATMMTSEYTLDVLASLKLPRYDLAAYLHPDAPYIANSYEKTFIEDSQMSRGIRLLALFELTSTNA